MKIEGKSQVNLDATIPQKFPPAAGKQLTTIVFSLTNGGKLYGKNNKKTLPVSKWERRTTGDC